MRASVVLPTPGGPQSTNELSSSPSIIWRNTLPGSSSLACPTTSSRLRGRMRSARGAEGGFKEPVLRFDQPRNQVDHTPPAALGEDILSSVVCKLQLASSTYR